MELSSKSLFNDFEVVSKCWHNLFHDLQFSYISFDYAAFFLIHLVTSCYIPVVSGYK